MHRSSTGRDSSEGLDRSLWLSGAGRRASGYGVAAGFLAQSGSSPDYCRIGDVVSFIRSLRKTYCGTVKIQWSAHFAQQENRAQDGGSKQVEVEVKVEQRADAQP